MDTFCPYRLGEVCSHVAALLFKIYAACRTIHLAHLSHAFGTRVMLIR